MRIKAESPKSSLARTRQESGDSGNLARGRPVRSASFRYRHFRGTTATTLDLPPLLSAPDHILFATTWMTFGSLLWFTGTVMLTVKLRSILSPETVPSYFVVTL